MEFVTSKRPGKYLVRGYTRANGATVKDYFRSYPTTTRQVDIKHGANSNSNLSVETRDLLKKFLVGGEDEKLEPYQDSAGVWTVGVGSTESVKPGEKITSKEAMRRLEKDIDKHKVGLDDVQRPLSNNEQIGLCSFLFNNGAKSLRGKRLLKHLNDRNKLGTAIGCPIF